MEVGAVLINSGLSIIGGNAMNNPIAKKSLGQHWLRDKHSLEAMVTSAMLQPSDTVLEIGPGQGDLTRQIVGSGAEVVALEFDSSLIPHLMTIFKNDLAGSLRIQQGDIRTFDLSALPKPYKIVANIPYYLSANLFRKLIDDTHKPIIASLLVQKEVAERVVAMPGKMSSVAVMLQLFYEVEAGVIVPAILFDPPPKVDSQILILKKRTQPLFPVSTDQFFHLVKAGFSQRRKKLKSSLKGRLGTVSLDELFSRSGVSPDARAQELSMQQWNLLYQTYISLL